MTVVRLDHVSKRLGATLAVDAVDLQIEAGELFFLLGPSGCGKSTLLGLIAGLHTPDAGRIWFGAEDVTDLPTDQRQAVMCFQSYALWPHMTVRENVRFGLDMRRTPSGEAERRVDAMLDLVRMKGFADRKPTQLSGGQQQRVALARALAVKPRCLLLDEPLSNLDAKLRYEMRGEIRRICKAVGLTTLYVTHDQKEALAIGERIAILNQGRVVQVGTPEELYGSPRTAFVAEFIGQANLIPGLIEERRDDHVRVKTALGSLVSTSVGVLPAATTNVVIGIRPEQVRIGDGSGEPVNRLDAAVRESSFLGESSEHLVVVNEHALRMVCSPPRVRLPERITVELDPRDVAVFAA